jgi:trigger factor
MSYNITVTKLPNSEVELKGEITAEAFEKFRTHAMKHVSEHVEVPGFRKGKVPADVLEKHVSPMAVLQEMADHAFNEFYPKMLDEHKIDAIGNPAIQVTKIAAGNPLGFTIRTATMPEVTLPDYKTIAKKEGKKIETEVTDEELEKAITELKKMRAQQEKPQSEAATEEVKEGEEKKEEVLPELTDEYVKALGPFENVADFKTKFRENLKNEKEHREHEKNRLAIIEKILGETKVEVPSLLIESELNRMLYQMQSDISRMGLSYEDYLKHLNKSEEAIREEFKPDAEKRVKILWL